MGISAVRCSSCHPPISDLSVVRIHLRRSICRHYPCTAYVRYVVPLSYTVSVCLLSSPCQEVLRRLRYADCACCFIRDGILGSVRQLESNCSSCWEGLPSRRWTRLVGEVLAAGGQVGWHSVSIWICPMGVILLRSQRISESLYTSIRARV